MTGFVFRDKLLSWCRQAVGLLALWLVTIAAAQAQTIDFSGDGFTGARLAGDYTSGNIRISYANSFGDNFIGSTSGGSGDGPSLFADAFDDPFETITIETIDGAEFDLQSFYVNDDMLNAGISRIDGYRDGSSVAGASVTTGIPAAGTVTLPDSFENVDRVVLTSSAAEGFWLYIDDIMYGPAVAADTDAPVVQSITVSGSPAANAASMSFVVDFDEDVNNADIDDFTLTTVSGTASGSIASVSSSSGDPITVTVNSIAGTGVLRLDLDGSTNIADGAGNSGPSAYSSGSTHTVDRDAPAAPSTPDMTAGTDAGASSTDNITSDTTPTFTGTSEANATITVSSSASGSLGTTTADGSGNWTFTPGSAMVNGSQTITATATDAAGNASAASSGLSIEIDAITPAAPGAPDMTADTDLGVSSSDNITSDTTPTFSGLAAANATITVISSQDGTLGTATSNGSGLWTYTAGSALSSGSHNITATATDSAGNTSSASSALAIEIDTTAPTITSIARQTPGVEVTNADSVTFRITFSDAVANVDSTDFAASGPSGATFGVAQNSTSVYDITVSGGDMAGLSATVDLGLAGGQNISDLAGNVISNTTPGSEQTYTLDNTAPSGYLVILDDDPVTVANQTATSFTFAGAEVGAGYSYTLTSSGGAGSVANTGTISTATDQISGIDVSGLPDGTLTLSVTLTDTAGNTGTAATDTATKEAQPPQINSITVAGSPLGSATSVDFTVAFTEAAQNISTDDFALTTTGTAAGTIASVSSATGATVTVTVNAISGDGTIRLDLDAATNIQDASGNSGPNAYTSGAAHTVDNTAPPAFNVAFVDSQIIQANETSTDIRFTTAEVGTTYAYSISSSGGGAPVTGTAAISTSTQNVTVNVSSLGDGTLTLTATLTDDAGNVTNQSSPDTIVKETDVPAFSVAFSPSSVLTGGTSTMTFTIDNSAVSLTATALDFTNNLPAGLTVATTPNASTTCTGGTLTATGGAGSISYSGGSVTTGTSCTVSADVTPSSAGSLANTSGALTSSVGNSGTASATLTATQPSLTVDDPSVTEGDAGTANLTFTVTLAPASSQTVTVDYATSDGTATAGSDYTAATGTLTFNPSVTTQTVSVVVSGDGVIEPDETVVLTLSNPSNATIGDATGTGTITTDDVQPADTTAPTLEMVNRSTPADERTNADSLTWLLDFSEAVVDLDAADFAVTGSTAGVTGVSGSGELYQVTVSGGDLADYDGVVGLQLSNPTIEDLSGNDLAGGLPSGAETYLLDNTGPVAILSSDLNGDATDPFTVRVAFDEVVTGLELSDFTLTNASVSALQTAGENEYTVLVTPGSSGTLSVGLAAATVTDALGNENPESETLTYETDSTAPILSSIQRDVDPVTSRDSVSWTVTFSEDVTGVSSSAFALSGGSGATVSVSGSGARYEVTVSGGSLADYEGVITLSISDAGAIKDAAGNAYAGRAPTGANEADIRIDNTSPVVTLSTQADTVSATFDVTVTFSEAVDGFSSADVEITNASIDAPVTVSAREYTLAVTPQSNGSVTLKVKAGAVQDAAGLTNAQSNTLTVETDTIAPVIENIVAGTDLVTKADALSWTVEFSETVTGVDASDFTLEGASGVSFTVTGSEASYEVTASGGDLADLDGEVQLQLVLPSDIVDVWDNAFAGEGPTNTDESRIELDNSGPTPTLSTPEEEVVGAFTLTIAFDEDVSDLSASALTVQNGTETGLTRVDSQTYTVSVQPEGVGEITMTVAEGAVQDGLGNPSSEATLSVQAVSEVQEVEVSIDLSESNPTGQIVTMPLTNPGRKRLPFQSRVTVGWLEPVVSDGVIPSLGSLDYQVRVTQQAQELDPGVYQGEVIVFTTVSGSSSASRSGMSAPMATQEVVIATIPVTLTVTTQNGTVQLVTTTPSGISGDVDVSFSSNVDVFNDVALTTVSGLAQTSVEDLESGRVDVTQTLPAGWRVESISCTGDLDGGSQANVETGSIQIDLDPNENLVCTFENVRDEDLVQLATQRAIRNFMLRRADRLIDSAPDLSTRLSARDGMGAGEYSANMDDGRYTMSLTASLAGARNQAKARHSDAPGMPSRMRDDVGRLDVWLSAELSGVTDNRAGERAESDFGVAQLGVDWAVSDDLLVGGMVQLDWMDETAREVFAEAGAIAGARVDGEGWMAGPYMVWRVADGVILDSMALYGMSSNTVNPLGLYEDEFDTDRWMLQANLTGEYGRGAFVVRPQATLTHFEETQDGYTDSLGIVIPSQSIALGRLAAGPELIWRQDSASGARWELRSKLRAVWDYQPADLLSETGTFMNSESDVRADGEIGIAATLQNGAVFELSVGMSGIGQDDFEANTARFQLRVPLSMGR